MPSYIATLEGLGEDDPGSQFVMPPRKQNSIIIGSMRQNELALRQSMRLINVLDKQIPEMREPRQRQVAMATRKNAANKAIKAAIQVASARRMVNQGAGLADMELQAGGTVSGSLSAGASGIKASTTAAMDTALNSGKAAAGSYVQKQVDEVFNQSKTVPAATATTSLTFSLRRAAEAARRLAAKQKQQPRSTFGVSRAIVTMKKKPAGAGLLALLAIGAAVALGS